jgi:AraC-like DNA-binding protein
VTTALGETAVTRRARSTIDQAMATVDAVGLTGTRTASTVDTAWLADTRTAVQRIAAEIAASELRDASALVDPLVASMSPPPDLLHRAALAVELLDACRSILEGLHDGLPREACACHAAGWTQMARFAAWQDDDPRLVFGEWLQRLLLHVEREHPPTAVAHVAALIRADPAQGWTLDRLAARAGVAPARVRDGFHHLFGLKPSAYVQLARAARAVVLFRTSQKVEAVASEVGYRSKKNLYAALARWVGATPTALRQLSDDERDWLARELRIRCLRRPTAGSADSPAPSGTPASRPRTQRRQSAPRRRR